MGGLLLGSAGMLVNKADKADAAVVGQLAYTDVFDGTNGVLSDSWKAFGGAGVKTDYNALRFNTENYEWNSHVINGKYKLEYDKIDTSCTIEMVLQEVDDNGQWFALSFGTEDIAYDFPYASGAMIFYSSDKAELFKAEGGTIAGTGIYDFDVFHGKKVKILITLTKLSGLKEYSVNVACHDAADGQLITSREFGSLRIEDGYFGFNSARFRADLFEFNVYEDGEATPVFADDFSNPVISYALESAENPVWHASSAWNKSNLIAGTIGKLDISAPNSGAVYAEAVERQESNQLYLLYTLGADFYVDEMEYADSGFIIGADENGNGGTFVGVRKTTDNVWAVSYEVGKEAEGTVCEDYISESVISLRAKVFYDNSVELTVGGHKDLFSAGQSAGYFGFKTFAYGAGESVGAYVDNFEYSFNEYVKRTSDDASLNFDDTIGTEIMGMTVYDYYCPTNAWYKASGLSLPIVVGEDGYLIFSNAGDYQCFAPKKKYNNFIVRFDVTFDVVKNGSTFGIEVGKTDISESATNSVFMGFQKQAEITHYVSNKCFSAEGTTNGTVTSQSGDTENVFVQGETYNFMAIAENGTVKLYLKKATDDESVLAYERARFVDVPTDGYVAMFANNVSLRMDNFSITNLDYEYFGGKYEAGETFRYNFAQGGGAEAYAAVAGGTFKKDNTVEIVRGSEGVSTVDNYGANVTRIRFASVEAGVTYNHGNVTVTMDEANGKITVSDGITEQFIELEAGFAYANSLMQIEETLGKISVSVISGDKPIAAIMGSVYEFAVNNDLTASKISVTTPYLASIKELSVFNLDTKVRIDSQVYVPQNVRLEKPSIQDGEKKGCSSAMGAEACAILTVCGLAAVLLKKKRGQNNG